MFNSASRLFRFSHRTDERDSLSPTFKVAPHRYVTAIITQKWGIIREPYGEGMRGLLEVVMNRFNPEIHHRRSIRLKNFDYSQPGAYFVTICSQNRQCLFGENKNAKIVLNDAGRMIAHIWHQIPACYPGNDIGEFVVMPNHIHGIIFVGVGLRAYPENGQPQGAGQPQGVAPTRWSLPDIVHRFKTMTTKQYADGVRQMGWQPFYGKLWQRNYYERVIRDEDELNKAGQYILSNPLRWALDGENPERTGVASLDEAIFE